MFHLQRILSLLLLGLLMIQTRPSYAQTTQQRLLFVGNSYTYGNDPFAINQQTTAMLQEIFPATPSHHQERVAQGGYLWERHLADMLDTAQNKPLRQFLITSQDPLHQWTWALFQEQSQIPGIGETDAYWRRSMDAIQKLTAAAQQRKAKSMLLMTWGRRDGDPQNQHIFPNFKAMNDRLRDGYLLYRSRASTPQQTVYLAPIGVAWAALYEQIKKSGQDPHKPESLWYRLYEGDGSHPSLLGSFLAAATTFASITGKDPRVLAYNPNKRLDEGDRKQLLEAAYQAVLQNQIADLPFPWTANNNEPTLEITNNEKPSLETSLERSSEIVPEASSETNANKEPLPEVSSETNANQETIPESVQETPLTHEQKASPQGCCHIAPTSFGDLGLLILISFGLIFSLRRSNRNLGG